MLAVLLKVASTARENTSLQMVLQYMPVALYVKFPDAEWQEDKKLGLGIARITPTYVVWALLTEDGRKRSKDMDLPLLPTLVAPRIHFKDRTSMPRLQIAIGGR